MIRELSVSHPNLFTCAINWYEVESASEYFEEPGNHAGELETSCMLHIAGQWVRPLDEAGDGAARSFKIEGLRDRWITTQRKWTSISNDTGDGNPRAATAAKGKNFLDAVTTKNRTPACGIIERRSGQHVRLISVLVRRLGHVCESVRIACPEIRHSF